MSNILLKSGNLNTTVIQKELVSALAEDHNYKVTDEAKKKHIATASSYDEFRHFVACADQKRVSHAEMESLGKPEKGWKSKTNLAIGQTGKLPKSQSKKKKNNNKTEISKKFPDTAPKNPMEFEREWRRHGTTPQLKFQLLTLCGPEALPRIFKTELDVSLLSSILKTFNDISELITQEKIEGTISGFPYQCLQLLNATTKTGRFPLNVQFLEEKDKDHVRKVLRWIEDSEGMSDKTAESDDGKSNEDKDDLISTIREAFKL